MRRVVWLIQHILCIQGVCHEFDDPRACRRAVAADDDERFQDLLLLAEQSLRVEWDAPEEDAAWAHLAGLPTC
jgi:hypothetical protein